MPLARYSTNDGNHWIDLSFLFHELAPNSTSPKIPYLPLPCGFFFPAHSPRACRFHDSPQAGLLRQRQRPAIAQLYVAHPKGGKSPVRTFVRNVLRQGESP